MSWQETTTGLYERPITLSEVGLLTPIAADRPLPREPFQIHCVAEVTALKSSDLVVQALRDAWLALRLLKSPDIATTFGDGKKYYRTPSPEELKIWLKQTVIMSPTGTTVQAAIREVYTRVEYLPVLYILPQPTDDGTFKGSVLLFISHWRTEASGCFMMLQQIFDYAADLLTDTSTTKGALSTHRPGSEVALLTPSIEEICMPNDQQTSAEARSRVEKYFALYESFLPCVSLPLQNDITTPYSHVKLHHRIYTPTSTSDLVRGCRSHNVTVTAAIHAAYLGAIWQITSPSEKHLNWASIVPAQVRTRLPATSPYRDQGCWSAAQMMMIVSPPDQSFLTRAQDLRQQYGIASSTTFMYEDMRALSERAANPTPNLPVGLPGVPFISSLGVLDRDLLSVEHDGITVREVAVYADNVGPGIVLTVWTFAGKLNLQISWNVAYHGDDQVEEILNMVEKTLTSELGTDLAAEQVKLLLL